jgi:hypothetical protein
MSLGCPEYGRLMELVWSPQVETTLRVWIERDAQLPSVTADEMGRDLGSILSERRMRLHDAVKRLGTLIEMLSVQPVEVLEAPGVRLVLNTGRPETH